MRAALFFVGTALLGGLAFWLPDIALHAARGANFSGANALALTGLLPIVAVVGAVVAQRLQGGARRTALVPLAVGLGVWVLGPCAMLVSATFSGGGFATQDWPVALPVLTALFPLTTFMMAAYDGSLGGLLLASVALVLLFTWNLARGSGGRAGPRTSRT